MQLTNVDEGLTNPKTEGKHFFHGGDAQKNCKENGRYFTTRHPGQRPSFVLRLSQHVAQLMT